jgi:hypothetical protein
MGVLVLANQFVWPLFWSLAVVAALGLVVYPLYRSVKNGDAPWAVAIAVGTLALVVPGMIVGLVYLLVSRRSAPRS